MKTLVVINPYSGAGKGHEMGQQLLVQLREKNWDFSLIESRSRLEMLEALEHLNNENKFELLICVGGDGLVHDLLPTLIKNSLPLLIVPAGTGNDLARTLHLYNVKIEKILDIPARSEPIKLDIGLIAHGSQKTPFIQVLSTGFDAVVNERANNFKFFRGKSKYIIATLLEVWRFKPLSFTLTIDGVKQIRLGMLVCVANGTSYGGGMKIVPHASRSDQLLDVLLVDRVSPIRLLMVFPRVFFGSHVRHPKVHFFKGKRIEISGETQAFADGEKISNLPITITLSPDILLAYSL